MSSKFIRNRDVRGKLMTVVASGREIRWDERELHANNKSNYHLQVQEIKL